MSCYTVSIYIINLFYVIKNTKIVILDRYNVKPKKYGITVVKLSSDYNSSRLVDILLETLVHRTGIAPIQLRLPPKTILFVMRSPEFTAAGNYFVHILINNSNEEGTYSVGTDIYYTYIDNITDMFSPRVEATDFYFTFGNIDGSSLINPNPDFMNTYFTINVKATYLNVTQNNAQFSGEMFNVPRISGVNGQDIGISKVDLQEKEVTIQDNGTEYVNPDFNLGYEGLGEVTINTNVPQYARQYLKYVSTDYNLLNQNYFDLENDSFIVVENESNVTVPNGSSILVINRNNNINSYHYIKIDSNNSGIDITKNVVNGNYYCVKNFLPRYNHIWLKDKSGKTICDFNILDCNVEGSAIYLPIFSDYYNNGLGPIENNKSLTISQNGTQTLTPSSGYSAVKSVNITTNVPQSVNANIESQVTRTLTSNGDYVITPTEGYDGIEQAEITVEVPPNSPNLENKTLTITQNGTQTVTPTSGYDGLGQVIINSEVPIPVFRVENKTQTITSNGTTTLTPTSGYDGLGQVTTTVNVTPNLQTNISKQYHYNGTYMIRPSTGYDGINEARVVVDVDIPDVTQISNYSITSNGNNQIIPIPNGYNAVDSISVDVNVPNTAPSPNIENGVVKNYTSNGTYYISPSSGYDGLGTFTVTVVVPNPSYPELGEI